MEKIGFVGLGKLGLDCAEVFAQHYETYGFDIYPRQSATVKIVDTIGEICDICDWIFIAVPTPHSPGYDGSTPSSHLPPCDFGYDAVMSVLESISQYAQSSKKIVLISTVLPGTVRTKFNSLLPANHQIYYNPYLIAMGTVKWDMVNPEMVIIGTSTGDADQIQPLIDLYKPLIQNHCRFVTGTWEECESIKIFYNTFISAKLSLVNMIQDFAMKIGHIDVDVVTDALAHSTQRIMGPKYMTAGMGDAGACHPRDNIALRWLAKEHDIGYDLFDTIMLAREMQAKNIARYLITLAHEHNLTGVPIVIHGKSYKPDVPYCIGSYSTLVGHYIKQLGLEVKYIDPSADDSTDVIDSIDQAAVVLMAHNRMVTYGYTGQNQKDFFYTDIPENSVVVDPWRAISKNTSYLVIHYGDSRQI
jgi:UDPglucose 6-dehydrogenase